jgi:hypothetical protein
LICDTPAVADETQRRDCYNWLDSNLDGKYIGFFPFGLLA